MSTCKLQIRSRKESVEGWGNHTSFKLSPTPLVVFSPKLLIFSDLRDCDMESDLLRKANGESTQVESF